MTTICLTPTCSARYNGPAAEAESVGGWRIMQLGILCPACLATLAKAFGPVLTDHLPTREQLALRVAELDHLQKTLNNAAAEYADTHQTTLKRLNAIARVFGWMEQTDDPTTSRLQERNDQLERDNVYLNTIIDTYQRRDLDQFTEIDGRGK